MADDDTPPPDRPNRPWDKDRGPRGRDSRRDDRDEDDDDRPRGRGSRRDRDDEEDDYDDRPRRRRRREYEEEEDYDPALKMVVPLNTSVLAIIAGYVGLISVLCLPAPFALLLGILALVHLKKNPKLDGKVRAIFAIVMGAVFTVPLVVILVSLALDQMK